MFKKYFLSLCIIGICNYSGAQSVGLVLSGGGSKGLAHIGVIKALEQNRIPIDCIGGTSMGAIIGGLYAMGYNTDEMMEIVRSDEFSYWMGGELTDEDLYYFKKERAGPDLLSIGLDPGDSIQRTMFPLSYIPNHLMDFAFMEIYGRASAAAAYDFDSLFVPFLCNAADISNSREIVFRKGDLSQAVRASMTVPLYFRPIVLDGNILYDGGIFNNFPVSHVEEAFQPDVILGSKAAEGNLPPDEFDILKQIENIVMRPSDYQLPEGRGVLVDMDFRETSLLAFDRLDEYVDKGYRMTMEKMDSIKMLVPRVAPDSAKLGALRMEFRDKWPEFHFGNVELSGLNEKQEYYVQRSIRLNDSLAAIDEMKKEYLKLVNDPSLTYLYPNAKYNPEDSLYTLNMRIIPEAPMEARFGLFISTTGLAQTYLGFSYREIQELSMHLKGSIQFGRFYNGVNLGFRFDYPSLKPFYFQGGFNYNGFDYNNTNRYFFFEDLEPSFINENEINFRFDIGMPYSMNGIVKAGLGIGRNQEVYYMLNDITSLDVSDNSVINQVSLYGAVENSTLNDKQFATRGLYSKLSLRVGSGQELYTPGTTSPDKSSDRFGYYWISAKLENYGYISMGRKVSLGYHYHLQATFKPMLNNYYSTIIEAPAFRPNLITSSLFMEKYRAHHFAAAGIMPVYNFNKRMHAKLEMYGFFPLQEISRGTDNEAIKGNYFSTARTFFNASFNFLSVAGPVGLHLAYISGQEKPWIVQLSFGYLLFNKKSTED